MITSSLLKKAGFIAGKWEDLESGDKYRVWSLTANDHYTIEVDEAFENGKTTFTPSLNSSGFIELKIDDVTKLLTIKELLK